MSTKPVPLAAGSGYRRRLTNASRLTAAGRRSRLRHQIRHWGPVARSRVSVDQPKFGLADAHRAFRPRRAESGGDHGKS
jgi:hypothetical protein